jgi:hypothetical protein
MRATGFAFRLGGSALVFFVLSHLFSYLPSGR